MPRALVPILVLAAVIALVVALLSGDGPEPTKTTNGTDPGSESTGEFDSASEAARSFETDETKTAETTEVVIPPPVDLEAADRDLDLFGRVIDPRGQPIPGAKIEILHRPGRRVSTLDVEAFETVVVLETLFSATDGTFSVRLPRGAIRDVRVTHSDFGEVELRKCLAGERLEITMFAGAKIDLLVVDGDGTPIPDVALKTFFLAGTPYTCERKGVTDAEGRAHFDGLPPGDLHVELIHPDFRLHWEDVSTIAGETVVREVALERGRVVKGRVTDRTTGAPIAGARVGIIWTLDRFVETDSDGRYSIPGVRERSHVEIHVEAKGYGRGTRQIPVSSVPSEEELIADVELAPGDVVIGTLIGPEGTPVAGAAVHTIASTHREFQMVEARRGISGSDGTFRIEDLHPDMPHSMVVMVPRYGRYLLDFDGEFADADRVIDLGEIVLPVGQSIEGVLVDENGEPYAGEQITLAGSNFDRRERIGGGKQTLGFYGSTEERRTDDLGRFRFPDLAPGSYEIRVRMPGRPQFTKPVALTPDSPDPVFVECVIEEGAETLVRFELADGSPVSEVYVVASLPAQGRSVSSRSDSSGVAKFVGISGAAHFQVSPPREFAPVPTFDLEMGGVPHVVVLQPAAWIRGVVLDPERNPVSNIMVGIRSEAEQHNIPTDASGAFESRIEPGALVDLIVTGVRRIPNGRFMTSDWIPLRGELRGIRAPSEDVELILERVATDRSLRVRCETPDGAPAEGVTVSILPGSSRRVELRTSSTNAEGLVEWTGLPATECLVSTYPPTPENPEESLWINAPPQVCTPDGQEITFVYRLGIQTPVEVVDASGSRVSMAQISYETDRGRRGSLHTRDGTGILLLEEGETATLRARLLPRAGRGLIAGEEVSGVTAGQESVVLTLDLD